MGKKKPEQEDGFLVEEIVSPAIANKLRRQKNVPTARRTKRTLEDPSQEPKTSGKRARRTKSGAQDDYVVKPVETHSSYEDAEVNDATTETASPPATRRGRPKKTVVSIAEATSPPTPVVGEISEPRSPKTPRQPTALTIARGNTEAIVNLTEGMWEFRETLRHIQGRLLKLEREWTDIATRRIPQKTGGIMTNPQTPEEILGALGLNPREQRLVEALLRIMMVVLDDRLGAFENAVRDYVEHELDKVMTSAAGQQPAPPQPTAQQGGQPTTQPPTTKAAQLSEGLQRVLGGLSELQRGWNEQRERQQRERERKQ